MSYILNIEKIVYDVSANSEFEKIYLNAFREAVSDYPPKKLTSSDYDERRDKVNKAISSVNENNKIIAEKSHPSFINIYGKTVSHHAIRRIFYRI